MDFRNFFQNFNIETLREKIPSLSALSAAMPEFRFPKCMEKLKTFRLFNRNSGDTIPPANESINRIDSMKIDESNEGKSLKNAAARPPPHRISTISSLMHQADEGEGEEKEKERLGNRSTYLRAGSIDDYPTPLTRQGAQELNESKKPNEEKTSLNNDGSDELDSSLKAPLTALERLKRLWGNLSEFKLRNLFNRETIVRKDNIGVDYYVERYEEDRQRDEIEQRKRDMKIADDYDIKFKTPNKPDGDSFEGSSDDEETTGRGPGLGKRPRRSVGEHSGDESGMELSPPPGRRKKPGIAATRFARVRTIPLRMSQEENDEEESDRNAASTANIAASNESTVFKIKSKTTNFKQQNVTQSQEATEDESLDIQDMEENSSDNKMHASISNDDKTIGKVIKHNFKMLQKSIKSAAPGVPSSDKTNESSEGEKEASSKMKLGRGARHITERLKRMRSFDSSAADAQLSENEEGSSKPTKMEFAAKLQNLKRNLRKSHSDADCTSAEEGDESPKKSRDSLITKLKNIRASKQAADDPDDDEQHRTTCKESFAARAKLQLEKGVVLASQMPQRTIKKINEGKRYFQRSLSDTKVETTPEKHEPHYESNRGHTPSNRTLKDPTDEEESYANSKHEYLKAMAESQEQIAAHSNTVAWTTKPILNDSSDLMKDEDFPRVLIHQDNTDAYESTLIIAVARSRTHSPTSVITELSPEASKLSGPQRRSLHSNSNSNSAWIPNKDMISSFLNESPSPTEFNVSDIRRKLKRQSLDSISSESGSWILDRQNKRNFRYTSVVELNVPCNEEDREGDNAWKAKPKTRDPKLTRTRSIDIFETTVQRNGVKRAFEDFDAELQNTPIVEIKANTIDETGNEEESVGVGAEKEVFTEVKLDYSNEIRDVDGFDRESSEELDAADDDNSSRVTKILAPLKLSNQEVNRKSPSPCIVEENPINNNVRESKKSMEMAQDETNFNSSTTNQIEVRNASSASSLSASSSSLSSSGVREHFETPLRETPPSSGMVGTSKLFEAPLSGPLNHLETSLKETPSSESLKNLEEPSSGTSALLETPTFGSLKPFEGPLKETPSPGTSKYHEAPSEEIRLSGIMEYLEAPTSKTLKYHEAPSEEIRSSEAPSSEASKYLEVPSGETKTSGIIEHLEAPSSGNTPKHLEGPLKATPLSTPLKHLEASTKNTVSPGKVEHLQPPLKGVFLQRSPSPPPLPKTKPPPVLFENSILMTDKEEPLILPERIRIGKPLVKTSSLRLTFNEQVNPKDIGKVNKLISRFEKPTNDNREKQIPRPLIIPRQPIMMENYSDDDEDDEFLNNKLNFERDATPTNEINIIHMIEDKNHNIEDRKKSPQSINNEIEQAKASSISSNILDTNSNFSGSEYGSPRTNPSSLIGSTEPTPQTERKQHDLPLKMQRHNRRSMTRDDDRFYSFDSDEENSYYSMSSTNSSRHVIEL